MLVGLQPLDREEAGFRQDAVVAAHGVAFRLDVDIALRVVEPVRRDVENAEIGAVNNSTCERSAPVWPPAGLLAFKRTIWRRTARALRSSV